MKIEKGIPVPEYIGGRGGKGVGKWQVVARSMDVNDSVFFAGQNRHYMSLYRAMKNMGFKPVSRWVGDGYRVWRVE